MMQTVGLIGAIALPFWNIPLILKIGRRRSSKDISVSWTLGVFGCLVLMLPAALTSLDVVFKTFSMLNIVLFTGVLIQVLRYR